VPTSSPSPNLLPPERDESDTGTLVGVVLAGGASRRMGTDKALLVVEGERMLDRAARHLREAGATEVVVASGVPDRYDTALVQVPDPPGQGGDGPLAGLAAAFAHFASTTAGSAAPVALVLAVDLPDADPALLAALAQQLRAGGGAGGGAAPAAHDEATEAAERPDGPAAVVPLDPSGRAQPLHAAYAVGRALPAITDALARGDRRVLRVVLDDLRARTVRTSADADARPWHRNLNTPTDARNQGSEE
jgi:molybdopterin-guanine dinucleotide biosynthesis protein A